MTVLTPPPPTLSPAPQWGTRVAWAVIVLSVAAAASINAYAAYRIEAVREGGGASTTAADPAEVQSLQLNLIGRYAVGTQALLLSKSSPAGGDPTAAAAMAPQVRQAAVSPLECLRAVPVIAEIDGAAAALTQLDSIPVGSAATPNTPLARDARSLRVIYTRGPDALDADARQALVRRHGWFGQLAVSFGKPPGDPLRQAALAPARQTVWAMMIAGLGVLGALAAGVALLITAVVLLAQGKLRSGYLASAGQSPTPASRATLPTLPPLPALPHPMQAYAGYAPAFGVGVTAFASPAAAPPSLAPTGLPRTGPFVEAFAIYLGGQLALSFLLHLLFHHVSLAMEWVMLGLIPLAILWPRWRGVSGADLRRGLGWHAGVAGARPRFWREVGLGVLGYLAGLPLCAAGIIVTLILTRATHAHTDHPITSEIGRSTLGNLQLYALACFWAPIVEETMFRGALLHHLRARWRWPASAALVALLFAAIHPQGWAAIPTLGAMALVFAALREWRGSLIAPVTAHALNNFLVTTMLIVMMG